MRLLLATLLLTFVVGVQAKGAGNKGRGYSDMREANWKDSDKDFHARGNYDAAKRFPWGRWADKVISEADQGNSGRGHEGSADDQEANDPNHYRPAGLADKY